MNYQTFDDLQTHLQALYQEGNFQAILELATQGIDQFPEQEPLLAYWQVCMAARTEQPALLYKILDRLLDQGFWFSQTLLRKSPSLAGLQGEAEYERRALHSLELEEQEHHQLYPLLTLRSTGRCSTGGPACPLLIGLHTNSGTAQDSLEFWQVAAASGWLVAAPQSSQALWKGAYVWNDRQICEEEINRHYQALLMQYAIDPARVVVAGHSMGGEMAIWLAIQGILPAEGFIAIGPGGPLMEEVENWTAMLGENPQRKLRGYVIFGQEDKTIPQENIRLLAEILNQAGIPTELEEVPDLGHDFAPEFVESLLRGLNFIDQN